MADSEEVGIVRIVGIVEIGAEIIGSRRNSLDSSQVDVGASTMVLTSTKESSRQVDLMFASTGSSESDLDSRHRERSQLRGSW